MLNLQTSKGRVIRLRVSSNAVASAGVARRPSAQFNNPSPSPRTLEDWKNSIESIMGGRGDDEEGAISPLLSEQSSIQHRGSGSSLILGCENDPSFEDISSMKSATDQVNKGSYSTMHLQDNPSFVNRASITSSHNKTKGHGGDVELGNIGTTHDMRGSATQAPKAAEEEKEEKGEKGEYSSDQQMKNGIPTWLYYVLAVLGACPFFAPHLCEDDKEDDDGNEEDQRDVPNRPSTEFTCFGLLNTKEKKFLFARFYQLGVRFLLVMAILWTITTNVCEAQCPYPLRNTISSTSNLMIEITLFCYITYIYPI